MGEGGPGFPWLPLGAVPGVLIIAAVIDVRKRVVPNALVVALVLAALVALAAEPAVAGAHLAAAATAAAVGLGLRASGYALGKGPGLGMGDVKLLAALGLAVGWPALWTLYLAAVLGSVYGLLMRRAGRHPPGHRLPFAPLITLGHSVALVFPLAKALQTLGFP